MLHFQGSKLFGDTANLVVKRTRVGAGLKDEADTENELIAWIPCVFDMNWVADEAEAKRCNTDQLSTEITGGDQMVTEVFCNFRRDELWRILIN